MNKVWKWVIGIVLGLVVLAVLASAAFMLRGNFHSFRPQLVDSRGFPQRGPGMMPFGGYEHMRAPGMMDYGMSPFGGSIGGFNESCAPVDVSSLVHGIQLFHPN